MTDPLPTPSLPLINAGSVPGFWIRTVGDETRIGAVHRSPRIIGAILAVGIWMIVFWQPFSNLANPSLYDIGASIFGVAVGMAFRRHLLDLLFGRTEVRIRADSAEVIRGIGWFDERQSFDPRLVTAVGGFDTGDGRTWTTLEGSGPIHLGLEWSEPRREAAARALAVHLGVPLLKIKSVYEHQRDATAAAAEQHQTDAPSGTWAIEEGNSLRLGATSRSLAAIPVGIFAAIWNGAILFIAWLIITGGKPWFLPLLALHGAFGSALAWVALHACFGRVEVRISGDHAELFEGVGRFRGHSRFAIGDVRGVRTETRRGSKASTTCTVIDADKPIEFGASLSPARRAWLNVQLYRHLVLYRR